MPAYVNGINQGFVLPAVTGVTDFTAALRFRLLSSQAYQAILAVVDDITKNNHIAFVRRSPGPTTLMGLQNYIINTGGNDQSLEGPSVGDDHTIVIRRSGTTSTTWIDGVLKLTATVDAASVTMQNIALGMFRAASDQAFANALLWDFSFRKSAWSDGNIATFHGGTAGHTLGTNLIYRMDLEDNLLETGGASVELVGDPVLEGDIVAPARIRAGWPKIGANLGTLFLLFEDEDGDLSKVVSLGAGITIRKNGGSPIELTDWLVSTYVSWAVCPLNPKPVDVMIDDLDDECTLNGTWDDNTVDSQSPLVYFLAGPGHGRFSYSNVPGDTAVYDFGELAAGTYQLQATFYPDTNRTTLARYVVKEGVTAKLTADIDQTELPTHDDNGHHHKWTLLGTFTTAGGAITVTASNPDGDGANYLVIDAVRCKQIITPLLEEGDTVTLTLPALSITTAAGIVAAVEDRAVTIETDETQFPYDAEGPHTLKIGENISNPYSYKPNQFYANLFHYGFTWAAHGPAVLEYDEVTREMTAGTALNGDYAVIEQIRTSFTPHTGEFIDSSGVDSFGPGTYTFFYSAVNTGEGPFTVTPFMSAFSTMTVENISAHEYLGGDRWKFTFDLADPFEGRYGNRWTLGIKTYGVIKSCVLYDPDTPDDWTMMVHPYLYEALHGTGIDCIRSMDLLLTNYTNISRFSDLVDGANISKIVYPVRVESATIATIGPVDTSEDDLDGAVAAFGSLNDKSVYKITTVTPHGMRAGEWGLTIRVTTDEPDYADTRGGTTPMDSAGQLGWVISDTEVLVSTNWNTDAPGYVPGDHTVPVTLAGTHTPTGTLQLWVGTLDYGQEAIVPLPHIVQVCNECEVKLWFCIPHPMEDETELALTADYLAANLDRECYVERSNEAWNFSFISWFHSFVRANEHGEFFNAQKWNAYKSAIDHGIFRARFVAAGRPASDVIRVIATQGENTGTGEIMLDYAQANAIEFDVFAPALYDQIRPIEGVDYWGASEDRNASWDRLSAGDAIDITPYTYKYNGIIERIDTTRADLDERGFEDVLIASYEASWSELAPLGSDKYERYTKAWAISRDPRFRTATFHLLQTYEDHGVTLYNQLAMQNVANLEYATYWLERARYNDPPGRGDGSDGKYDNRINPFDQSRCVSVIAQAHLDWAASVTPTPTPTPTPTSYTFYRTVDFGPSRGGLTTVGYRLTGGSRITAGVAEVGTNTGIYGATIIAEPDFAGAILWDTGEGASTVYAAGEINPPGVKIAEDGLDDALDAAEAIGGGTLREAIRAMAAALAGALVQSSSPDGQTAAATIKDFKDDATTRITSTSTRTARTVEVLD